MNNRTRSFFWPILLIGAGVVLLLANMNVIPLPSLAFLFRLWPVILIVAGLDILIGRRVPWVSGLIALVAVAGLVVLAILAPTLGWANNPQARTGQFSEPVGAAESARVTLDLSQAPTKIHSLGDSSNLIDADLVYMGEIVFNAQGTQEKTVSLRQASGFDFNWDNPFSLSPEVRWDIGLTPDIPLALEVDGASGEAEIDLSDLELAGLVLDMGSGQISLTLPEGGAHFVTRIVGGSGQVEIDVPAGADVELEIDGGSGAITINAPDTAVRVEVQDSGSGEVRVPAGLRQVSSGDDDEGVWEAEDYGSAERRVTITVDDVGSGSIVVR